MNDPLSHLDHWPARAAAGVIDGSGSVIETAGPLGEVFPWASVTKILTALATWIAVEEGTVAWDDPAGPPGSTVSHLLAHASGLGPDGDAVLAPPGRRRIYSNRGFEVLSEHVAGRSGMHFQEYVSAGVIEPLRLEATTLHGSPASGASGPLSDLLKVAAELARPTLVSEHTLDRATQVAFPGLAGVLPGFGRQDPNDWGLGVEIRDAKAPHWTGTRNSSRTFGHFGQSGSFVWVDPVRNLALCSLAGEHFGDWAIEAWPTLSDAVISAYQPDGS